MTLSPSLLAVLGCVLAFVVREIMAFSARRNDNPVSLRYYWSLPKNRWTVITNMLLTALAMIGRNEIIDAAIANPKLTESWPMAGAVAVMLMKAPFWTGAGIGLFGAFVLRWLITTLDQRFGRSKKIRQEVKENVQLDTPNDGNP